MTLPTYEVTTRVEYAAGYAEGYGQGLALLTDQASAYVGEHEAALVAFVRTAASPFTRAYALGMLRGLRHACWGVR